MEWGGARRGATARAAGESARQGEDGSAQSSRELWALSTGLGQGESRRTAPVSSEEGDIEILGGHGRGGFAWGREQGGESILMGRGGGGEVECRYSFSGCVVELGHRGCGFGGRIGVIHRVQGGGKIREVQKGYQCWTAEYTVDKLQRPSELYTTYGIKTTYTGRVSSMFLGTEQKRAFLTNDLILCVDDPGVSNMNSMECYARLDMIDHSSHSKCSFEVWVYDERNCRGIERSRLWDDSAMRRDGFASDAKVIIVFDICNGFGVRDFIDLYRCGLDREGEEFGRSGDI
ncbi:hypothetical protein Tco_1001931 [Tanacetum coccineum]|uniref:Uncharacterized protein n=1 Tax=Tanacetum coccineum TaxID=301880 RepID=A0ABQ5F6D2_9ASTR